MDDWITAPEWTTKHGYFLQMGGFKLACSQEEAYADVMSGCRSWRAVQEKYTYKSQLGDGMLEGVLHFQSFLLLLQEHKIDFPLTTAEEIDDRSKGDALSKGIALLQITWFIIQLIARRFQGLTITELELTTAALAGLNSVMYVFWWNKPLDVRCPIVIRTKAVEKMLAKRPVEEHVWKFNNPNDFWLFVYLLRAFLGVFSSARSLCQMGWAFMDLLFRSLLTSLASCLCAIRRSATKLAHDSAQNPGQPNDGSSSAESIRKNEDSESGRIANSVGANVEEAKRLTSADSKAPPVVEPTTNNETKTGLKLYKQMKQILGPVFTFAGNASQKLILIPRIIMFMPMDAILEPWMYIDDLEVYSDAREKMHNKSSLKLLFDEDDMNWIMSMIFYCEHADSKPFLYFSAVAGAAFGYIHCAAWNVDFPSDVEQIIWRTASLTLVGICLSIFLGESAEKFLRPVLQRSVERYRSWGLGIYFFFKDIAFIPTVIYPIARLTLLILALLSLRHLPESSLQTVTWTKFIPHI